MTEPGGDRPPPRRPSDDRLDSWKEIAAYVGRDVSTVQRWEKRERMPVHRHLHDKLGSVYAYRSDLDEWLRTRHLPAPPRETGPPVVQTAVAEPPRVRSGGTRAKYVLAGFGAALLIVAAAAVWFGTTRAAWHNPVADATFQRLTDFEGVQDAATISRDGRFVAFLSNRDGPTDVWVTQVGSGQFHNLTHGAMTDLINPSVRMLGFSPDGASVTFWARTGGAAPSVGIWAVPTLGGPPRPLFDGVAECDWSADGSRLAFHTTDAGDPVFVSDSSSTTSARRIFTAPKGEHSHFPIWARDGRFVYFVEGSVVAQRLDLWRVPSGGGPTERVTFHNGVVAYPTLLNSRTLLYLATDADRSGPWLYGMDLARRIPHRLIQGPDRYTSLAASADGRRLVATLTTPSHTLWRMPLTDTAIDGSGAARIPLPTLAGSSPRQQSAVLFYVADAGKGESLWRVTDRGGTELWTGPGAQLLGGPAPSPDGARIAFSARLGGHSLLYVMQADGTSVRIVTAAFSLQGAPAWTPDGRSLIVAALDPVEPHLFRVPVDGGPPVRLTREYSTDPAASPDGRFVVFSGPDVGPTFALHAVREDGAAYALPALTLTRGARRVVFLPRSHDLLVLRGDLQHKNLWRIDLDSGAAVQLTTFPSGFDIRDFDVSADGRQLVVERMREQSDVILLDLPRS